MTSAADDFSSLADAFLGGAVPRGHSDLARMPTLLVVGNVPTLAGIWIAQYVDQRARSEGPIALVRLDGAASRGELFRAQGRAMPAHATAWMDRASAVTNRWVLCADSQVQARSIARSGCPIVLMCGTDEAALAAARRTVESIETAARDAGISRLKVGLALVGSPDDAARDAARRFSSWTRERAPGVEVHLAMLAQRVDRVESTGPVPLPMFSDLEAESAAELIAISIDGSATRFEARDERKSAQSAAPLSIPTLVGRTATTVVPVTERRSDTPSLAAHFPEFSAIPFVCPEAPEVTIACDRAGALHLIATGSNANALRAARAWARGNWRLLSAANPTINEAAARVIEHMVLDDAREAVSLHRSGVLLHALIAPAGVSESGRIRVDLNDERTAGLA